MTFKYCKNCKKRFYIKNGKHKQKFCSLTCYYKFPKSEATKRKISEYVLKNPIKNRPKGKNVYNWNKIAKICIVCKGVFLVSPSHNNVNHCSRKCYDKVTNKIHKIGEKNYRWHGDPCNYRGSKWPKIRKKIYERDNYTCQICGKHKNEGIRLVAHHKIPRALGKKISEDIGININIDNAHNLVTLCASCHAKIENTFYNKTIKQGKIPLLITRIK